MNQRIPINQTLNREGREKRNEGKSQGRRISKDEHKMEANVIHIEYPLYTYYHLVDAS